MEEYKNIFKELKDKILECITKANSIDELTELKNKYLSKKGEFSLLMGKIKEATDKKSFGEAYNQARNAIESELTNKLEAFKKQKLKEDLEKEKVDITLPGNNYKVGCENPFYKVKKEIEDKSRKNGLNSLMTKDDICNKNKFYEEVLEVLTGETIKKLDDAFYIDKKVYENVKKDLLEYLNKNKEITVAQFRDITKSNRKISIVMLEHFDRNRITKRVEDKRILY